MPFFGTDARKGLVRSAEFTHRETESEGRNACRRFGAGSLFPATSSDDWEASARTHGWARPPQQNKQADRPEAKSPASGARCVSTPPAPVRPSGAASLGGSLLPALLVSMIKYLVTFPLKQQDTAESDRGSIFPTELIIICCLRNWSERLRASGKRGGRWVFPAENGRAGRDPSVPVSPAGCFSVVFHARREKLDGGLGTGPRGLPPRRCASSPVSTPDLVSTRTLTVK